MKSAGSRQRPRTPDGLDQVYGVHALQSLLERGEAPKEIWVQQGAGNRLSELLTQAGGQGRRFKNIPGRFWTS